MSSATAYFNVDHAFPGGPGLASTYVPIPPPSITASEFKSPSDQDWMCSMLPFPRLASSISQGYTYSPSPAELYEKVMQQPEMLVRSLQSKQSPTINASYASYASVCKNLPRSLAAVENFCVMREGVGSVRWLEKVYVWGVDLETIVQINHGGS